MQERYFVQGTSGKRIPNSLGCDHESSLHTLVSGLVQGVDREGFSLPPYQHVPALLCVTALPAP